MVRINVKTCALSVFAVLATSSLACGGNGDAAPVLDGSTPTPQPTEEPRELEKLTGDDLLERVSQTIGQVQSLEVTLAYEFISPEGNQSVQKTIWSESPRRVRILTQDDDGAMEEIYVQNRVLTRKAVSLDMIEDQRWTAGVGSDPTWFEFVVSIMENLDKPDENTGTGSDDYYTLTGSVTNPRLGSSPPPPVTHVWRFDGGRFQAQVAPETFAPKYVSFDRHEVFEAIDDRYESFERFVKFTVEFRSFNEPVTVSIPAHEMVDEAVRPTATSTSASGGNR